MTAAARGRGQSLFTLHLKHKMLSNWRAAHFEPSFLLAELNKCSASSSEGTVEESRQRGVGEVSFNGVKIMRCGRRARLQTIQCSYYIHSLVASLLKRAVS